MFDMSGVSATSSQYVNINMFLFKGNGAVNVALLRCYVRLVYSG